MTRTKNLLLLGTLIPAIVLSQGSFAAPSLQLAQAQSGDDDRPDPRRPRGSGGQERPDRGGQERPGARPAPGQPPAARPAAPERPAGVNPNAPRPPSAPQAAPPANRAEPEQPRRPTPPAGAAPGQGAPSTAPGVPQRPAPGQIAPQPSPARPSAPPAQPNASGAPSGDSQRRPAPSQTAPSQPPATAPSAPTAPARPAPGQAAPGSSGQPSAAPPAGRAPGALSQPGTAPSQQPGLNRQPGQAAPGQPSAAPPAGRAPGALSQPGTAPPQPAPSQPQPGLTRQPGQPAPGQAAPAQPAPGQGALGGGVQPNPAQPAPAPNAGRAPGALSQPGAAPAQPAPVPGQQPGALSQPGAVPGQVQPTQPGIPGQAGQPVPDRQGRRGGIGLGGAAAIGLGAAAIGGIMATQGASRLDDIRSRREERREGDVTIIREPGRTIIRGDDDRVIIRRDETQRFRDLGLDTRSERRGEETVTVYDRPDGTQIVTVTDAEGRLIRRSRRERDGGEFVIIDNVRRDGPQARFAEEVVELPPPPLRIPRERYIVDAERADERLIYETITAPPVAPVPRRYTLDEVRYSRDLRAHMRSVDIDTINFDSGSWTVTQDQAGRLRVIAQAVRQAVERAPNEVFMVEGHTDAVGSDVDNLSLSDRRAQSVAEILTRDFAIPAENLTTQGYGEQYPKVQTQGDSRENRRVTLRRITPLLTGQNQQ
ncbi:OmpA family protein [Bosea sp. NPDC055332]